jgi:hypothetical protein
MADETKVSAASILAIRGIIAVMSGSVQIDDHGLNDGNAHPAKAKHIL